jgi:hypothetical protein
VLSILFLVGCGALGVLLFRFASLIIWDLFGAVPLPWKSRSRTAAATATFKGWFMFSMFIAGCAIALLGFLLGERLPLIRLSNDWALLIGFSVPVILCFLLRCATAICYGIVLLYQRTENVYAAIKSASVRFWRWIGSFLRKRGLKE